MSHWSARSPELLLLTFAAGALDAVCYLRGHAFVANMTGNTVLVGISVLAQERPQLLNRSIALASFLVGVTMAALLLARRPEADESTELRRGLALEAPLLAAFCIFWVLDATNAFRCAPALLVRGRARSGFRAWP